MGKSMSINAYEDSGNTLRDPFCGKSVLVLSPSLCAQLLPEGLSRVLKSQLPPHQCFEELSRMHPGVFSLIPYSTAGDSGLMVCIKPERVTVNGKKDPRLLGISPREITINGCGAIIGV